MATYQIKYNKLILYYNSISALREFLKYPGAGNRERINLNFFTNFPPSCSNTSSRLGPRSEYLSLSRNTRILPRNLRGKIKTIYCRVKRFQTYKLKLNKDS